MQNPALFLCGIAFLLSGCTSIGHGEWCYKHHALVYTAPIGEGKYTPECKSREVLKSVRKVLR